MDAVSLVENVPDSTIPVLTGCFAFGTTLCLSTFTQKLLGISTASKIVPSVFGFATVCFASIASQRAAVCSYDYLQEKRPFQDLIRDSKIRKKYADKLIRPTSSNSSTEYFNIGNTIKIPLHEARVCAVGLASFKLLGGRFWAIAPSSFTHLGSFSRWSIPCTDKYANSSQRTMIERMGRKWGCHTCGSRMVGYTAGNFRFVGDHMPPKSVAKQMNKSWLRRVGLLPQVKYRFYPQCVNCSNIQGNVLGKASSELSGKWFLPASVKAENLLQAGSGRAAHFHGLRFRLNHLTGGVLAGATVVKATKSDVSERNKKRFQRLTRPIETFVK